MWAKFRYWTLNTNKKKIGSTWAEGKMCPFQNSFSRGWSKRIRSENDFDYIWYKAHRCSGTQLMNVLLEKFERQIQKSNKSSSIKLDKSAICKCAVAFSFLLSFLVGKIAKSFKRKKYEWIGLYQVREAKKKKLNIKSTFGDLCVKC